MCVRAAHGEKVIFETLREKLFLGGLKSKKTKSRLFCYILSRTKKQPKNSQASLVAIEKARVESDMKENISEE